jgi:hypothetical protein
LKLGAVAWGGLHWVAVAVGFLLGLIIGAKIGVFSYVLLLAAFAFVVYSQMQK